MNPLPPPFRFSSASPQRSAALGSPSCRSSSGFTVVELIVAAAVLAIVMGIGFRSFASFLQERRLRQSAVELVSFLQTARSRAMKQAQSEASAQARFCEIQRTNLSFAPSSRIGNGCNDADSAPLAALDLAAVSGVRDLTISGSSDNITFTNLGLLSSWNPDTSVSTAPIAMPRMMYLAASNTDAQYCIFLDLVSIRLGFRNATSGACTFNRG